MMQLRPQDIIHKSYLDRVLIEVIDRPHLAQHLAFKGGTCASMLGFLDRFSVDLDFDLLAKDQSGRMRKEFHALFHHLGFTVVKEAKNTLFFQVKYVSKTPLARSTIKISAIDMATKSNEYTVQYFAEIDRLMKSQTIETLFANKLVAVVDRYAKHHTIAGRDIYDIHHYFIAGYAYSGAVIEERTHGTVCAYFSDLIAFIQKHVTQTIVNEDLNALLAPDRFREIRKVLLPETLHFLTMEYTRLNH